MGRKRGDCWRWQAIHDGASRTEAAGEIGSVTLQIVRDWVVNFNIHGPVGLISNTLGGQAEGPVVC